MEKNKNLEIYANENEIYKWHEPPINVTKQALHPKYSLAVDLPSEAYRKLRTLGQFNIPINHLNLGDKLKEEISNPDIIAVLKDGSQEHLIKMKEDTEKWKATRPFTIINLYEIVNHDK